MINFNTQEFITNLFSWFNSHKRDLPWRKTYTPYHIWISEIMLQQTQMERGVDYFNKWIKKYPNPSAIANATLQDISQSWEGLGYYSRARNIYKASQIIHNNYQGIIPCDEKILKNLPGIGDYTLCAIMGIAFEKDFATIDANVERVFSRLFNLTQKDLKKACFPLVNSLLPKGQARIYNQALMELGALICKKNPQCFLCPVISFCEAKKLNLENYRPIPKEKKEYIPVLASFVIIQTPQKQIFIQQRTEQKLWHNMWEFYGIDNIFLEPTLKINHNEQEKLAKQSLTQDLIKTLSINEQEIIFESNAIHVTSTYTNHKLSAYFFVWNISKEQEQHIQHTLKGIFTHNVHQYAMASHHRKASQKLLV